MVHSSHSYLEIFAPKVEAILRLVVVHSSGTSIAPQSTRVRLLRRGTRQLNTSSERQAGCQKQTRPIRERDYHFVVIPLHFGTSSPEDVVRMSLDNWVCLNKKGAIKELVSCVFNSSPERSLFRVSGWFAAKSPRI